MRQSLVLAFMAWSLSFASAPSTVAQEAFPNARILSIGGDVTETLYALGFADRIVAVDSTSQFPPAALRDKANVGYMRALSAEGVLSVGPQIIIASDKAGPADVVKALKAATAYVEIHEDMKPEGVPGKIEAIARAMRAEAAGRKLAAEVQRDLDALSQERAKITTPLRALFVLNVQNGRLIVGGAETSADAMLRLCALDNAAGEVRGYKPVSDEALMLMKPDVVLVMRSAAGHETDQIGNIPGLQATPAGAQKRILSVDGNDFLGMGPRIGKTARAMMERIYDRGPQRQTKAD